MPLTGGERAALWRKRQRDDPAKHEAYKAKERERYKKRKQSGQIKPINELSDREQRKKRRNWKNNQRAKRQKEKEVLNAVRSQLSPPSSPTPVNNLGEANRSRGRRKKNLNRSKAYRDQFKLRIELNNERRLKNKYKSRYYRIRNNNDATSEINKEVQKIMKKKDETKTHLTHYCLLLKIIKKRYTKANTAEKHLIKTVLYRESILRRYKISMEYAKQKTGVTEHRIRKNSNPMTKQTMLKSILEAFYERDDNSRIKGGKRYTITRRKIKKQIRLLNDSIKHLHEKFVFESGRKISYSLFAKMKPFWVIRASEKDRETCLCKIHENPTMKANKLFDEHVLETKNLHHLISCIACNTKNKKCMYRQCDNCKHLKIKTRPETENLNYGKIIEWKEWKPDVIEKEKMSEKGEVIKKRYNITIKKTEVGTITTLVNELQEEIVRLARHEYNISHQYIQLKQLKDSVKTNELILHIDFSENYLCKYQTEIQSVHFGFSKSQVSIHTVMANTQQKTKSFATVSDNTSHRVCGIWAHLKPVLNHMKQLHPELNTLHVISDGPTSQYRSKMNFYMFSTKLFDLGFSSGTWNFMEAGHGKGAPDGIGATIKRTADTVVNTLGKDITKTADLIDGIRKYGTTIELIEIPEEDFLAAEKDIPSKEDIPSVTVTMILHQIVVKQKGVISSRVLSCFCKNGECTCFGLKSTTLLQSQERPSVSSEQQCAVTEPELLTISGLQPVEELTDDLTGRFCVVEYDGMPYPGRILSVDEQEAEVSAMHRIGVNRFFWPLIEDRMKYQVDEIVTMLPYEPISVARRHRKLDDQIWKDICSKLKLDDQGKK